MKNNIKKLSDKNDNLNPYIQEANLSKDIMDVLEKYDGIISSVSALGVLELAKQDIINNIE